MGLRITTFNVEWMNDFFYPDEPRLKISHKKGRYTGPEIKDVPALCSRIQGTIREVDPDILGIVEGPKLPSQMEKFVQEYLNDQSGNPIYDVVASPANVPNDNTPPFDFNKYQALGKTPAEVAGLDLGLGSNKWESLIKKAATRADPRHQ